MKRWWRFEVYKTAGEYYFTHARCDCFILDNKLFGIRIVMNDANSSFWIEWRKASNIVTGVSLNKRMKQIIDMLTDTALKYYCDYFKENDEYYFYAKRVLLKRTTSLGKVLYRG